MQYQNPYNSIDLYGFAGVSIVQSIGGLKYGIGTEVEIHKNISLFAEVFAIDLQNNVQDDLNLVFKPVKDYIDKNSKPEQIIIHNEDVPNKKYRVILNQLGLKHYIDQNSIKAKGATLNIKSITGFKVGVTVYFKAEDETFYSDY